MKQVFDYVIYYTPSEPDAEHVDTIIERGSMIDESERTVLIKVSRKIPDVYLDKLDDVKITIRSF